jgi:hypothetical protein
MRRPRLLVAVLLAGASVLGVASPVGAEGETERPASFCGTARRYTEQFSPLRGQDFSDTDVLEAAYRAAKRIAREAPASLKPAFRTLIRYYDRLEAQDFDVTDPELIEELATSGVKAARAASRIARELEKRCDLDVGV